MKSLDALMDDLADVISDENALEYNTAFALFDKNLILQKDEQGLFRIDDVKKYYAICLGRTKKEYSAKFMNSIALQMMFEE